VKSVKRISSEPILYLIAGIMAVGGFISASLTADPRWMEWHLSRLGEGEHLSSVVFNTSCALASLLMGEFARRVVNDLGIIAMPKKTLVSAQRILGWGLGVVAVCMMGIAVFPFDKYPIIHNIFGYGMTVVYLIIITQLPVLLPIFTKKFAAFTYGFVLLMAALFGIYFATGGTKPPLIQIEIIGLLFFFLWVIILMRSIRVHNRT
jgi:hypothetical protein